jgi:hypothetical protein
VSTVVLTASDASKILNVDRVAGAEVGESDSTSERVGRILDGLGWPAAERAITSTATRMTATTLAGSALTELQRVADHEHSDFHIDGLGRVRFTQRSARFNASSRTFSDVAADITGGAFEYETLSAVTDDDVVINDAAVANTGGTVATAVDATSMARYGRSAYRSLDNSWTHPSETTSWAGAVVSIFANQVNRFATLTLRPDVDDALWPVVLGAQLGDRITITRTPPGGGSVITRQCFIEGMSHDVSPTGGSAAGVWRTTWQLSDATSWPALTPAKWGTAKWGTADWFF